MIATKLSPGRRMALDVLANAPGNRARESTVTSTHRNDLRLPTITRRSRVWLSGEGLIEATTPPVGGGQWGNHGWYALTPAGLQLARDHGLGR